MTHECFTLSRPELISKVMIQVKLLDTDKKNQLIESMLNSMTTWPVRMIATDLGLKVVD